MDIDAELTQVFRDTFADPGLVVTDATSADDIPAWDSSTHIVLIFALEDRFGIQFSHGDLESLSNVGDLKAAIARRTDAA